MIVAGGIVTLKPVGGIVSNNPAMAQAQIEAQQQREAQRQADIAERTPHMYSKVDNCTVYIWKNGSYNSYFTKCDNTNKVVTEFSHSESCGKACTKKVDEKVETN